MRQCEMTEMMQFYFIKSSQPPYEIGFVIISIKQMNKLRLRRSVICPGILSW